MIAAISSIDTATLHFFYAIRDPLLVQIFIWIDSFVSSWRGVYGLAAIVAILLLRKRHFAYATGIVIATASSGLFVLILKGLVARARPDIAFAAYHELWYSFPSADVALTTSLYTFLTFLTWQLTGSWWIRSIVFLLSAFIIMVIAVSRLYLGVHYFSDVSAGLVLGLACASLAVEWVTYSR